jgi:hypothetical protein
MTRTERDNIRAYSGIFGHQVTLKAHGNKVIMTLPHAKMKVRKTEKQKAWQRKFQSASRCAKYILRDPEVLKAYRAMAVKGQTAYNLVLRDCLNGSYEKQKKVVCNYVKPVEPISIPAEVIRPETVKRYIDPQKTVPCRQPGMREILFPGPAGLRVYARPAAQIGNRRVQWSNLVPGLFKSERCSGGEIVTRDT